MPRRRCGPLDQQIGANICALRMRTGLSQAALGERIGVTFQQIQKYERGTNRISASLLFRVSQILDVPIEYFFSHDPDT
jgi:transcriptional regulator with XRE-family HTH domain